MASEQEHQVQIVHFMSAEAKAVIKKGKAAFTGIGAPAQRLIRKYKSPFHRSVVRKGNPIKGRHQEQFASIWQGYIVASRENVPHTRNTVEAER